MNNYPIEKIDKELLKSLKEELFFSRNFNFVESGVDKGLFYWKYKTFKNKHPSIFLNASDIMLTLDMLTLDNDDREIFVRIIKSGNIAQKLSLLARFLDNYIIEKN